VYFEAKSPAYPVVQGAVALTSWWDEREAHLVWGLQVSNNIPGIPGFTHQREAFHPNHHTSDNNYEQGKVQVSLCSLPVQGSGYTGL